jgi:hypothetical protein
VAGAQPGGAPAVAGTVRVFRQAARRGAARQSYQRAAQHLGWPDRNQATASPEWRCHCRPLHSFCVMPGMSDGSIVAARAGELCPCAVGRRFLDHCSHHHERYGQAAVDGTAAANGQGDGTALTRQGGQH